MTMLIDGFDDDELSAEELLTVCHKQKAEIAELVEMLQTAFTQGYEAGHHDTVEGGYTDASDVYEDWIEDWISEGNTELVNIDLINKHKKEG